ncbi:hypothetical protein RN02_29485 [Pseudomonas sp. PI1]|nr:hypothetical protein RN02_29485 [Pseudomonas sp. PI1]
MVINGGCAGGRLYAVDHTEYSVVAEQLSKATADQSPHGVGDQDDFHLLHLLSGGLAAVAVMRQHGVFDEVAYGLGGVAVGAQPIVATAPHIELVGCGVLKFFLVQRLGLAEFLAIVTGRGQGLVAPPGFQFAELEDVVQSLLQHGHDWVVGATHYCAPATEARGFLGKAGLSRINGTAVVHLNLIRVQ